MKPNSTLMLIKALRPNQWVKNFILFTSIIFNRKLFDPKYLYLSLSGFVIFCAISSASYLFNDIIDLRYDKLHPEKKKRPLASGLIPIHTALETAFLLAFFGLISALFVSTAFFFAALLFTILHVFYSTSLKKY